MKTNGVGKPVDWMSNRSLAEVWAPPKTPKPYAGKEEPSNGLTGAQWKFLEKLRSGPVRPGQFEWVTFYALRLDGYAEKIGLNAQITDKGRLKLDQHS